MDIKPKHVANLFLTIKYPPQYNSCAMTVLTVYMDDPKVNENDFFAQRGRVRKG